MARPQEAPLKSRINLAVKLFKMNNVFFTFHSLSVSTKKKKKKDNNVYWHTGTAIWSHKSNLQDLAS